MLNTISLAKVNNELELAGTNGFVLAVYRQPITELEDVADDLKLALTFPKKFKANPRKKYIIESKDTDYILIGDEGREYLSKSESAFPNYNAIIPADLDKLPKAEKFTLFRVDAWEVAYKILGEDLYTHPIGKSENVPHFWKVKNWLVCIMPMRMK